METYDDPIRTALRSRLGDDVADALIKKIGSYSNYPNAVKGAAKAVAAPATESAALALVEDPAFAEPLGLDEYGPGSAFWVLLTLAARADIGVVDRMTEVLGDKEYARKLLASIRRAATKHAAAAADGAAPADAGAAGPQVPQKVSEVKAWLAANADADPGVLAPYPGQKAAARVAAVRALGTIGTPRALEVLGQYADDRYPNAVLDELHKAWASFDRRDFAATMFRPNAWTLDLGVAPSLEGIAAVPGLTSLDVRLTGRADLSPLAECTGLRALRVAAQDAAGLVGVEPLLGLSELEELHLTETTGTADLTPLAGLGVQRLRIGLDGADGSFLLRMPRLERLLLSRGEDGNDPALADIVLALVRKGVRVVVYRHEHAWVAGLLEKAAGAEEVFVVEKSGYVGLTNDESAVELLGHHLFSNIVP